MKGDEQHSYIMPENDFKFVKDMKSDLVGMGYIISISKEEGEYYSLYHVKSLEHAKDNNIKILFL